MADSLTNDRTRFRMLIWFLYFMMWTFIGLVSSIQNYVVEFEKGKDFGWPLIISFNLPFWWFWMVSTPFILWSAKKLPIRRAHFASIIFFHFCLSITFVVFHEFLQSLWCNYIFSTTYYLPVLKKLRWRLLHLEWGFVDWMVYWTIFLGGYAIDFYNRFQERELRFAQLQNQLTESKLQALKMQIHPHFLFNTLNALSTIVKQGKKKQADAMISLLAGFLRTTLEEGTKDEISFEKELDFVKKYLEMEKIRFQDKLTVRLDIDAAILTAHVPHLILQPIVENAVRYGIAQRETPGCITLRALKENENIRIQVEDDGPGITGIASQSTSFGIGLMNVQRRLQTLYGDAQSMEISNLAMGGFLVDIKIPFHEEPTSAMDNHLIVLN